MAAILIILFLLGPSLALGVRRKWRPAIVIWMLLVIASVSLWIVPAPDYYDQQDEMGHDALGMILVFFAIAWPIAYAIGSGVASFRDRRDRKTEKKVFE